MNVIKVILKGVICMSDRLLKVSEIADILKVSQMTVIRMCRDGRLPFIRVGNMRRIKEIDLEYYILNPNKKPKAPEPEMSDGRLREAATAH